MLVSETKTTTRPFAFSIINIFLFTQAELHLLWLSVT